MHDNHDINQQMGAEAPHAHESPAVSLVDYHVFSTIHAQLRNPLRVGPMQGSTSAEDVLSGIEGHFKQLDWLTGLSRRILAGDVAAQQLLASWLESHTYYTSEDEDSRLQQVHNTEHMGDEDTIGEDQFQSGQDRSLGLNVRAIRELYLGTAYATGRDAAVRGKALDLIHTTLVRSIQLLDVLHHYASLGFNGSEHAETLPNLLNQLPRGDELTTFLFGHPLLPKTPKLPPLLEINPILECLDGLRHGTVGSRSAFNTLINEMEDDLNLTSLIDRIDPNNVCAGGEVTLYAHPSDPAKKFPAAKPNGYGVFLNPCGGELNIKNWTTDYVTIETTEFNRSGYVMFRRHPSDQAFAAAQQAENQALESFGACLAHFGLGRPDMGSITIAPESLNCTYLSVNPASYLKVRHRPEISSFEARDPSGRSIGIDGVEAGTTVTVSWEVLSDDTAPLQISTLGAKNMAGLPPTGSLILSAQDMRTQQNLTLQAVNSCGDTTRQIIITVFRKLYLSPAPLSFKINTTGALTAGALTIRSSCPVVNDVTVSLAASSPDAPTLPPRVTVPANATIPAGQDRVTVAVSPAFGGNIDAYVAALNHSQPAANVTANAPQHTSAAVDVWTEPSSGQSKIVSPTRTDIVAVHMALLHTGSVLMFTADDSDFGHIDKVKTRVWDPTTNTVIEPSFPYPTHKNLFCAGHCILPDGRVLVVGGHAIYAGGSAAKQVHTFNPATMSWSRHSPMQKDRWYPTCLTLADGRALITSGSEAGGPPTGWSEFWGKGIVRDVEIFDPGTGGLTNFPNIHGDICMYPYMFVLPGGMLFFHSRNVSWLFTPGPGTWSPTSGSWSAEIPMKGSTTRTYPGMAGCVLLPLLPENAYEPKILMAGGGGAREADLNANTPATQSAEILDIDVNGNTGMWRNTRRGGGPLLMTTLRLMSDAVLLPDGRVLFVNGAAVGKADDSHVPVVFAELFDPITETFQGFTSISVPRLYHGTALLLPDGRVAVAGHTKEWNKPPVELNRFEVEVISPPYLFRGPRPQINYVAQRITYGQNIEIYTDRPSDIVRIALVRPGSVTHQLNTDQRYVGLAIIQRSNQIVTVQAPPNGTVAPPGYYLLFVVDHQGVPSIGHFVRVGLSL